MPPGLFKCNTDTKKSQNTVSKKKYCIFYFQSKHIILPLANWGVCEWTKRKDNHGFIGMGLHLHANITEWWGYSERGKGWGGVVHDQTGTLSIYLSIFRKLVQFNRSVFSHFFISSPPPPPSPSSAPRKLAPPPLLYHPLPLPFWSWGPTVPSRCTAACGTWLP